MGRKKKAGPRDRHGDISRAKNPKNYTPPKPENEEPLALRARVFGLSLAEARDQKAGSFMGRLNLAYKSNRLDPAGLSDEQYDAGLRYLELRNQFHKLIGAQSAIYEYANGTPSVMADEDRAKQWVRIKSRWQAAIDCIRQEQQNSRANLVTALEQCVVLDRTCTQLVGDLRIALNALSKFFRDGRSASR